MAKEEQGVKLILCRICETEHAPDADCPDAATTEEATRRDVRGRIWREEIEEEERGKLAKSRKPKEEPKRGKRPFGFGR